MSAPDNLAELHAELVDPTDEDLDLFDCGDAEVTTYFKSRTWFKADSGKASPPTYRFRVAPGGDVVGYAAVSPGKRGHPSDASDAKTKYLVVYALGVHNTFKGQLRSNGEKYAAALLRRLEQLPRPNGLVGIYLWVRSDNVRAIRFYEKVGFVRDPGGPLKRREGSPHLTMRKLW